VAAGALALGVCAVFSADLRTVTAHHSAGVAREAGEEEFVTAILGEVSADRLSDEMIRHVGHAPHDDVALLLIYRDAA
jgi:hypothetical protein